jgi:hypothetical protein
MRLVSRFVIIKLSGRTSRKLKNASRTGVEVRRDPLVRPVAVLGRVARAAACGRARAHHSPHPPQLQIGSTGPCVVMRGLRAAPPRPRPRGAVDSLHEALPNSRRVSLAGCGHLPWVENPHDFRQAVTTFLTQQAHAIACSTDNRLSWGCRGDWPLWRSTGRVAQSRLFSSMRLPTSGPPDGVTTTTADRRLRIGNTSTNVCLFVDSGDPTVSNLVQDGRTTSRPRTEIDRGNPRHLTQPGKRDGR